MIVLVIKISASIFTLPNLDPHPHLESAFGMRIPDADPGDQNHADPQHWFLWMYTVASQSHDGRM